MFGRMMNNYYYGKSGKGDFRKEDMPSNRRQLFTDTLRTRLSALCRINLMYMLIFLPTIIVMLISFTQFLSSTSNLLVIQENDYAGYVELVTANEGQTQISEEQFNEIKNSDIDYGALAESILFRMLIWLVPCLAITGPCTAGLCYVTRNWARDEHAFIWSDFKDAVKENWKVSLPLSIITGILPAALYAGYDFYGEKAAESFIWLVPMILVGMIGFIWSFSITYMHPMAVTYDLKLKDVISNSVKLGIARLPMSVGIRLLHCVPLLLVFLIGELFGIDMMICLMILTGYYLLIGFALSRFVTASYTNAVFDRFINTKIEGAKVNQGLNPKDDDEDDDEEETEE